jgi:putative glutamine amidotransferase
VLEGTRLAGLIGPGTHAVNSFHHQAVRRLGTGLTVSARAGDGTVEAIELAAGFVIGVQWHAEALADLRLFEALVDAAAEPALRAVA